MKEDQAKAFLSDVSQHSLFRVHMGTNIGNLYELRDALTIISDASFNHHVTSSKNDFAAWIKNVVKDKELAQAIEHVKDRLKMRDIISQRVSELENHAIGETFAEDTRKTVLDFIMGIVIGIIIGLAISMIGKI